MGQSGQIQLREHTLGLIVAQVPELPSDPGPQTHRVRTRGQQILVMIEFQDERVKALEMPEKVWRHRAQIGQDPEAPIVCGYDELARLIRIVRNDGRRQGKYTDLEFAFRREFNDRISVGQSPVGAAMCARGRINRDSVLARKRGGARNMVVVFVGQNDR